MPKLKVKNDQETKAGLILEKLAEHYPRAKTSLAYSNAYQLFVATVLSAQTTDEQVNKITEKLFREVPSFEAMALMRPSDLEPYLKSCGLYRHKSRFLIDAAKMIVEKHGGKVPDDFDELLKLPGVGRKTASIIVSGAYGKPALAVDTHVFRVSKRLGLADGVNVNIVEEQLKRVIPNEEWVPAHHRLIAHGRSLCHARKPQCENCFLASLCLYAQKGGINK